MYRMYNVAGDNYGLPGDDDQPEWPSPVGVAAVVFFILVCVLTLILL